MFIITICVSIIIMIAIIILDIRTILFLCYLFKWWAIWRDNISMDNDKNLFSFYYEKNVHDLNRKAFLCVQFAFSHWNKLMFFSKYLISDFHNISYWTQLILLLICVWAIFFTLQYRQKCLFKRQACVFGFHCLIEIVELVYRQPFTTIIQHYNDPS